MTTKEFIEGIENTFQYCLRLVIDKNRDYAEDGNPFKNFMMSLQVRVDPRRAILVRITDKIARISNLLDKDSSISRESIYDSIFDVINYCAILKELQKDYEDANDDIKFSSEDEETYEEKAERINASETISKRKIGITY